jgi:3-mercaptopyruvate sulfurtransferase SseA
VPYYKVKIKIKTKHNVHLKFIFICVKPEKYEINENKELIRNYEQILDNIKRQEEQLIDARSSDAFEDGHIPNSRNIAYNNLFDETNGVLKETFQLDDCKLTSHF